MGQTHDFHTGEWGLLPVQSKVILTQTMMYHDCQRKCKFKSTACRTNYTMMFCTLIQLMSQYTGYSLSTNLCHYSEVRTSIIEKKKKRRGVTYNHHFLYPRPEAPSYWYSCMHYILPKKFGKSRTRGIAIFFKILPSFTFIGQITV